MNLITKAYAAGSTLAPTPAATPAAEANATIADAPSPAEAFGLNMLLIGILIALFYILLIVPQQKRFKKHRAMIEGMKKGDKIITTAGFIGTIDKIEPGSDEIVVDLGNGLKVTALRSTIQSRMKDKKEETPANKDTADEKKSAKK